MTEKVVNCPYCKRPLKPRVLDFISHSHSEVGVEKDQELAEASMTDKSKVIWCCPECSYCRSG